MLTTALVKISLKEPPGQMEEMVSTLKFFGTRKVHLVHIQTSAGQPLAGKKRAQLDRIRDRAEASGLVTEVHILAGHAPTRILQAVSQLGADYIAITWVHKAVLRQALFGSIDSDIVRLTDSPVFIFKHRYLSSNETMEGVLYATDFQATDGRVIPYLRNHEFQARALYMLHVGERAPDPETDKKRREEILANLNRLANKCGHAFDRVETLETVGPVSRTIVKTAKNTGVDLIIVGKVDHPDMFKKLTGSVADQLPHRAPCSVFIIPGLGPPQPELDTTGEERV